MDELLHHCAAIGAHQADDFRWSNLRRLVLSRLKGGSVLDLGCGTGHMALACLQRGHAVVAVDLSPEMTALARKLASEHGYALETVEVDLETGVGPLAGRSFDNVVCLDVLEHLEHDEGALAGIVPLLAPGGRLVVAVPAVPWLYGARDRKIGHRRRYNKGDLAAMLRRAGLRPRAIRYWGFLGFLTFVLFEKVLRRPVAEGFRYSGRGRWRNRLLSLWYRLVENPLSPPIGLSLLAVSEPVDESR